MAINRIAAPSGVMAYSPSFMVLQATAGEVSTDISFYDVDSNPHTWLVYFDVDGLAYIDLSYIARIMYKPEKIYKDLGLPFATGFLVEFDSGNGNYSTDNVVFGSYYVGDTLLPPKLVFWEGFPFTVDLVPYDFDTTTGKHWFAADRALYRYLKRSGGYVWEMTVATSQVGGRRPVFSEPYIEKFGVRVGLTYEVICEVEMRSGCDDGNTYVRFIDHLGRLRYWLFGSSIETITSATDEIITEQFMPYLPDDDTEIWQKVPRLAPDEVTGTYWEGDIKNRHTNETRTIKCAAMSLPYDEALLVSEILSSPRVDLYLTDAQGNKYWHTISGVSGSVTADPRRLNNAEFTFTLKNRKYWLW